MSYCTLFYDNYLDKGWCMAESLHNVDPDANIYILCMNDRCYTILKDLSLDGVCLIQINQFEDQELLEVKNQRSLAEYCWTCTGKLIKYVLMNYGEDVCTYVDADMFFYSNPNVLYDEMKKDNCSVQVVPHRFPNSTRGRIQEIDSGKNCVQFNTFTKEDRSLRLLDLWISECINECSYRIKGDQKYTDNWGEYAFVNVSNNQGAGVAPWNITSYKLMNNAIYLRNRNKKCELIFYHFENIVYINRKEVLIEPPIQYWKMDFSLIEKLYIPYLLNLENKKTILEVNYNWCPVAKVYSAENDKSKQSLISRIKANKGASLSVIFMKINDNIRRWLRMEKAIIRF